jgi:hypothetical protein
VANLILPSRFTQQPQYPVELKSEWRKDLAFVQNFADGRVRIDGLGVDVNGKYAAITSSSNPFDTGFQVLQPNKTLLLFVSPSVDSTINYVGYINNNNAIFLRHSDYGNSWGLYGDAVAISSGAVLTSGGPAYALAISTKYANETQIYNYRHTNGVKTASTGVVNNQTETLKLRAYPGLEAYAKGRVYLAVGWNRQLSDAELADIGYNPWQIFRKRPQILYFDVGGGATTYTHNASLSAAIQQAQAATASLQAAIQAPQFVTASADAAIAQARTASADLQAAIQLARSATANADAAIQTTGSATASADAAIVAAMSLEASLDAYIQALAERYARPDADVSDGDWLPSTPGDLFAMLDEETASDTDYIYTETASTCVIRLSDVADPATSDHHVLRYRVRSAEGSTLVATLKQGATTIATRTHSALGTDWTTLEMNLSGPETDAITDYTDLTVTFAASDGGTSGNRLLLQSGDGYLLQSGDSLLLQEAA